MAETTIFPGKTEVPPPPPPTKTPTNPPGRPRKDGLPAGSALAPVAPTDPEDFFLALPAITPDQWAFRTLYLYRLYPITDRRGSGQPVYLTKYPEPVDRDRVMRDFGSGVYKLELLETLPNEKGKKLSVCAFQILNTDYPPKVPAGDWVDDVRNADWEWCRAKLGPHGTPTGSSAEEIAAAVVKVHHAMNPPKSDETPAWITALSPLLLKLIPDPPAQVEPKEDKTLGLLFTMLQEQLKDSREEIREMRKAQAAAAATPPAPQKDMLDSLLENKEKFEALKGLFGKGNNGPAAPEGWAGVADKFVDKIGSALTTVAPVIAQRLMMPAPQQQIQPPRTPVVQATAQPLPAPADPPVQQQPIQQQPAPAQPPMPDISPEDQAALATLWQKYGEVINASLNQLVDHFENEDGYFFRDWFLSRKGAETWKGMKRDISIDQFVQVSKFGQFRRSDGQVVPLSDVFKPEEKFRVFLADFFTPVGEERPDAGYADDEDDDDGAEETLPK